MSLKYLMIPSCTHTLKNGSDSKFYKHFIITKLRNKFFKIKSTDPSISNNLPYCTKSQVCFNISNINLIYILFHIKIKALADGTAHKAKMRQASLMA